MKKVNFLTGIFAILLMFASSFGLVSCGNGTTTTPSGNEETEKPNNPSDGEKPGDEGGNQGGGTVSNNTAEGFTFVLSNTENNGAFFKCSISWDDDNKAIDSADDITEIAYASVEGIVKVLNFTVSGKTATFNLDGPDGNIRGKTNENLSFTLNTADTSIYDVILNYTDSNVTAAGSKTVINSTEVEKRFVSVSELLVSVDSIIVGEGDENFFDVTVLPANATDKSFTVTCSNEEAVGVSIEGNRVLLSGLAIVEDCLVTVKSNDGDFEKTVLVSVTAPVSIETITSDTESLSLKEGETSNITVTVAPEEATNKNLSVSSSDENVATASVSGNTVSVKAIAGGSAVITISAQDPNSTASLEIPVTVEGLPYKVSVANIEGAGAEFTFAWTDSDYALSSNPEEAIKDFKFDINVKNTMAGRPCTDYSSTYYFSTMGADWATKASFDFSCTVNTLSGKRYNLTGTMNKSTGLLENLVMEEIEVIPQLVIADVLSLKEGATSVLPIEAIDIADFDINSIELDFDDTVLSCEIVDGNLKVTGLAAVEASVITVTFGTLSASCTVSVFGSDSVVPLEIASKSEIGGAGLNLYYTNDVTPPAKENVTVTVETVAFAEAYKNLTVAFDRVEISEKGRLYILFNAGIDPNVDPDFEHIVNVSFEADGTIYEGTARFKANKFVE